MEISELLLPAIVKQILQFIKELVCHTFDNKKELTAKSRPPTTFVFSYAATKNCIITVLWLLPWHLFSWRFGLPSAYFLLNHAPGGICMSLLIYMHSFSCIILLHLPVVFCIGILLGLCVSSGFSCTCRSPEKYLWFEPFFGFANILAMGGCQNRYKI